MMRAGVRSGYVAAKRRLIGPPSERPRRAARSEPAASITARTSSIRVSRLAMPATRSDAPVPRLSKTISRANDAMRSRKAANASRNGVSASHMSSTFETAPGMRTRSNGPSPTTW
jgi:hypothetical protein